MLFLNIFAQFFQIKFFYSVFYLFFEVKFETSKLLFHLFSNLEILKSAPTPNKHQQHKKKN